MFCRKWVILQGKYCKTKFVKTETVFPLFILRAQDFSALYMWVTELEVHHYGSVLAVVDIATESLPASYAMMLTLEVTLEIQSQ
jgi:hypothetical protein